MDQQRNAEMLRIIARHKAKLLTALEDVNCPEVYLSAVKSRIDWLRNDLIDNEVKFGTKGA